MVDEIGRENVPRTGEFVRLYRFVGGTKFITGYFRHVTSSPAREQ
ncbi:MAG: hypothetical protein UZ13_00410 [Chloroflexi bacterium OLB13]|nr:MAG: hypothetical protein UZ13_00410 [Chloroflexi bacterium OLB13]